MQHGEFESTEWRSNCKECNSVFKFVDELEAAVIGVDDQAGNVLKLAKRKFEMYMGHKVRAKVQIERIVEMFQWEKDGEARKRIVVFMDYKMKVVPERLRETQLQFYGKSG